MELPKEEQRNHLRHVYDLGATCAGNIVSLTTGGEINDWYRQNHL